MVNFRFELYFKLKDGEDPGSYEDVLYDEGCDDASLGIGRKGAMGLIFNREADTAKEAIYSAIKDVNKAIPHAVLHHTGLYLMNLTDIAELLGMTKQNLSKYVTGKAACSHSFPQAILMSGNASVWYVAEVNAWFLNHKILQIDRPLRDLVQELWRVNQDIAVLDIAV